MLQNTPLHHAPPAVKLYCNTIQELYLCTAGNHHFLLPTHTKEAIVLKTHQRKEGKQDIKLDIQHH